MPTTNLKSYNYQLTRYNGQISRAFQWETPTAEPALNDEFNFFKIQKDAKFLDLLVAADQIDTGGAPTLSLDVKLTDGTTTHTLLSGWTGARDSTAANRIARLELPDVMGKVLAGAAVWRVYLEWAAVAQTYAAGTIGLRVEYDLSDTSSGA